MSWLGSPLRRALLAVIGLLLITLPVFAWMRYATSYCGRPHPAGLACDSGPLPSTLLDDGSWYYAFWQGGLPPDDYWPLGVALLGATVAAESVLRVRRRRAA